MIVRILVRRGAGAEHVLPPIGSGFKSRHQSSFFSTLMGLKLLIQTIQFVYRCVKPINIQSHVLNINSFLYI